MEEKTQIAGLTIEEWKSKKCAQYGCYNRSFAGFIYCVNHLDGFHDKFPDEVIVALKKLGV